MHFLVPFSILSIQFGIRSKTTICNVNNNWRNEIHNVPFFISMYKYTFILKKQNKCINSSLQLEYFQIM